MKVGSVAEMSPIYRVAMQGMTLLLNAPLATVQLCKLHLSAH